MVFNIFLRNLLTIKLIASVKNNILEKKSFFIRSKWKGIETEVITMGSITRQINSTAPSQWDRARLIIVHKKGTYRKLQSRPIILWSVDTYKSSIANVQIVYEDKYKLLINLVNKRGSERDTAGVNGHLQVMKTLIEKCVEYNKSLLVIFVD